MQRLYDFLRRNPTGVDTFWAVFLFGISLLIRGAFMVWMAFKLRGARHSEPGATVPA